jgi:hypothetical protein
MNSLEDEFLSIRFMTVLTPDSFLRKIIVISTVYSTNSKDGETSMAQVEALNTHNIDYKNLDWKKICGHEKRTLDEVKNIHDRISNTKRFIDCDDIDGLRSMTSTQQ